MPLSASFFVNNRKKLSKFVSGGLTIVAANGLLQRTGDSVYPFRQDSNFFYLTGLNDPDLLLVMHGSEEFLVLPKRSHVEDIFGGVIDCDEIAKKSGIKRIFDNKAGWDEIKRLQQSCKKINVLKAPPRRVLHTDSFSTNPNRRYLEERLKRCDSSTKLFDIRLKLASMRQIKQPEEIEVIKQAINITGQGLARAKHLIKTGVTGHELKAELDKNFSMVGVGHGFTPIVTSGLDTAVMHSLNYSKKLVNNEAVLFDVGAEVENYTADITRTYFNGPNTERFNDVYSAVSKVKKQTENILNTGVYWRDLAAQVDELMGEQLISLGLIKINKRSEVRRYFSHAIGHSLGLDAHDVCDYTVPIQQGMIVTIEPGIYIPEEGFGVRIEDDYLVTGKGLDNLSSDISYT
jgi:Xaa-Pro aminopeptidase